MKVGIICAGDRELAPFLPHIEQCKTSQKAMLTFYEGFIKKVSIVTLFCGVCKTNAAIATQILIDTYHVDYVINAGTAGGMDERLNIFDTVISTEVAHHDVHEVILTDFHPWMPSVFFKSDDVLLQRSRSAVARFAPGHEIYFGRMVTGESFITDSGRDEINAVFEPLTVDMETASIAHVCYVNNLPFIAVRTLTDTATHSGAEHFDKNVVTASHIAKDIVLEVLKEMKEADRSGGDKQ